MLSGGGVANGHFFSEDVGVAAGGFDEAHKDIHGGGLSCAVGAEKASY